MFNSSNLISKPRRRKLFTPMTPPDDDDTIMENNNNNNFSAVNFQNIQKIESSEKSKSNNEITSISIHQDKMCVNNNGKLRITML